MNEMKRRDFLRASAMAAGAMTAGVAGAQAAAAEKPIWACLLHLGMNSWKDIPLNRAPADASRSFKVRCMADYLRTDEGVWRQLTDRLGKSGANMLIIDLAEGVYLPSHPELSVKGTWSIEKFQKELARLRGMGLEVIPKMNFSTCHDSWLKDYQRMVSTKQYYQVCADVIKDAIEIFTLDGKPPRFFHLGYDEETAAHQSTFELAIVRQGELWWHDFLWFAKQVESKGVRPWIWSDYCWHHKDEFLNRMPKSVIQSNWYYGAEFDVSKMGDSSPYVQTYVDLAKAGCVQVPTGSNWSCDTNFADTVTFCRKNCPAEHLKGFMMASWQRTIPEELEKGLKGIDQLAAAVARG